MIEVCNVALCVTKLWNENLSCLQAKLCWHPIVLVRRDTFYARLETLETVNKVIRSKGLCCLQFASLGVGHKNSLRPAVANAGAVDCATFGLQFSAWSYCRRFLVVTFLKVRPEIEIRIAKTVMVLRMLVLFFWRAQFGTLCLFLSPRMHAICVGQSYYLTLLMEVWGATDNQSRLCILNWKKVNASMTTVAFKSGGKANRRDVPYLSWFQYEFSLENVGAGP